MIFREPQYSATPTAAGWTVIALSPASPSQEKNGRL
jgi:hypothetical protein